MFPELPFSLEVGGIVALADLRPIVQRTALAGNASFYDIFILAPGIHLHQEAPELASAGGELPITAAMTTDYVFRVENQATVGFLQRVGTPGALQNVTVAPAANMIDALGWKSALAYGTAVAVTVAAFLLLIVEGEWWTVGMFGVLMLARLINVVIVKRRAKLGWKGAPEKGVPSDLLVLLSQDRWVRITGWTDDVKCVTSGQWLRDMNAPESAAAATATVLVYLTAALSSQSSTIGNIVLMATLLINVGLLGISNRLATGCMMYNKVLRAKPGGPKNYDRRRDMAYELIEETARIQWALGLGMVVAGDDEAIARYEKAKKEREEKVPKESKNVEENIRAVEKEDKVADDAAFKLLKQPQGVVSV